MNETDTFEPTPILIEHRFPLDLSHSISTVRDLYNSSKQLRWDPSTAIPWSDFDRSIYDSQALESASLSWSRRAWTEYTGLPETPALLIRFCLEAGREIDPKYFLSVRNTEEAWHLDCCHQFAEALGGYKAAPSDRRYADLFNQNFQKHALDAEQSLDAYVAVHCALEDGIDLELWRGYLANAEKGSVAQHILMRCVEDKKRHAAFGWFYLEERAAGFSDETRNTISAELESYLNTITLGGYHCAWLVPDGAAKDIVAADRITSESALGACTPEEEKKILSNYLKVARGNFASMGINLPKFDIPVATS